MLLTRRVHDRSWRNSFLIDKIYSYFQRDKISYRNSVQIQLYSITLKMPNTLIENDSFASGFLGYFMESPARLEFSLKYTERFTKTKRKLITAY